MFRRVLPSLLESLTQELSALSERDRFRQCPPFHGGTPDGPSRTHDLLHGQAVLNFCSNDYLGLACHPAVAEAAASSSRRSGFGAGAARLVSGEQQEHRLLEQQLAAHVGLPAALLFPSGYQANIGVVTTLAGPGDLLVSDAANHASIIDGCRLSRATVRVYPHRDVDAARLALSADPSQYRRRILLTESLFSMDGDLAPLAALAELARASEAALVVDEAHALGVLGPGGRGLCAAAGIVPDALVGTLGKALGSAGGFVAGSPELRSILQNRARTFIFTTAAPPSVAAAAHAALQLATSPEGDRRRAILSAHVTALLSRTPRAPAAHSSAIVPIILGDDRLALHTSRALLDRGLFVQAIRPPTVPEGTARLRLTLSAAHTPGEVDRLAAVLTDLLAAS
jgi:8-amino-7-oxononanoate synthase